MSPLPSTRRYPALQSTLARYADVLDAADARNTSPRRTVTVTVTATAWGTTTVTLAPLPTLSLASSSSVPGMSRTAIGSLATSTELPPVHCPPSEELANTTVTVSSVASGGSSPDSGSSSSLRTGLATGVVSGVVVGVLLVIAVAIVYVLHRRGKHVRQVLRRLWGGSRDYGCTGRSERPSIGSTLSRSRRTPEDESLHTIRPYSVGYNSSGEAPPSYDELSSHETRTAIAIPEPAALPASSSRKGATEQTAYSPSEESLSSPSTQTFLTVSTYASST